MPTIENSTSMPSTRRTLTIMQATAMAGVSRRTVYNWMDTGKVEWIRTAGGSRRIFADSLFRTADGYPITVTHG